MLLPFEQRTTLPIKPRLDSHVLLYHQQGEQIDLYAYYSVMQGSAFLQNVGNWTEDGGLRLIPEVERRDFHAQKLRIASAETPPFVHSLRKGASRGFILDLVQEMEQHFNFEADFVASFDGFYGTKVNGSWIGMIKMLLDNDADLIAADLAMNIQRLEGNCEHAKNKGFFFASD